MDKSLGTNLYLWGFFQTRKTNSQARIHLPLASPSPPARPPPTYNVGHMYTLFFQSFNIVGGGGVKQCNLKRVTVLFLKSVLKTQKMNAITH